MQAEEAHFPSKHNNKMRHSTTLVVTSLLVIRKAEKK
jgi:hypothetical protein